MSSHQQTQRLGDHHRVQQDLANGAYSYVAGNYTVKHGAREIILGKALRRSIADAYAAFVAQVDGLPKDAYGKALHALDHAYPADFNATGMHDFNMTASVFVTSRSKHAAICNTAKQILYNLDEHQRKVYKVCPPPLRDLAKRAPVREETHLSHMSHTYSPTRGLQSPTESVDTKISHRRTAKSFVASDGPVSPARGQQRRLITQMASFDPEAPENHNSLRSNEATGNDGRRMERKRKGLLSGKNKAAGTSGPLNVMRNDNATTTSDSINSFPAHPSRPHSAMPYSRNDRDLQSSVNSQDLAVQLISQEALAISQRRNHQRCSKPEMQPHMDDVSTSMHGSGTRVPSATPGVRFAAHPVVPHLRVAEYYKKDGTQTSINTTRISPEKSQQVDEGTHTTHSVQDGGLNKMSAMQAAGNTQFSTSNKGGSSNGMTTRRYHTDNGAYNFDSSHASPPLLPGQSVAVALSFTVTDARLLQLIHMYQAAHQKQFEKRAETDERNAAMYAQQAAARGVCSPGRSRRIVKQGQGLMLRRKLSMPLVVAV